MQRIAERRPFSVGEEMRTPFSCAHFTIGSCVERVNSATSRTPTSSDHCRDAVIPAKTRYGTVIITQSRAAELDGGVYLVSPLRSPVPSEAFHLAIAQPS